VRIRAFYAISLSLFSTALGATPAPGALKPVAPAHSAGAVRGLIEEGNQRYAQGDYAGALERYRGARAGGDSHGLEGVGGVEAAYNEAVTLHAMGEIEPAKELLRRVEASPEAGRLAAMSRYNQGVIEYEQQGGEGEAQGVDPQQRLGELENAAASFRRALDMEQRDDDAAKNLELTRREIEQLRELIEQMQQQEQEQQQDQNQDQEEQQQDQQDQQQQDQEGGEQEQQQQDGEQEGQEQEQEQDQQQQQEQEGEGEEQEQEEQQAQIGEEGEEDGEGQDLAERLIEREAEKREEMRRAKGKREPVEKDW
jgi:Ca-activated chloride channel family protein